MTFAPGQYASTRETPRPPEVELLLQYGRREAEPLDLGDAQGFEDRFGDPRRAFDRPRRVGCASIARAGLVERGELAGRHATAADRLVGHGEADGRMTCAGDAHGGVRDRGHGQAVDHHGGDLIDNEMALDDASLPCGSAVPDKHVHEPRRADERHAEKRCRRFEREDRARVLPVDRMDLGEVSIPCA
ncbi:hypothetical protein GCM10010910_00790 [Microbacterium nanhaiense]|uniref:Uncharacterized protein n=1 Tax=Microbacterium nanhaiense TaxID=1301026 RepID=A0ABQ2MUD0_9MICO|nr:hypothetical protein [Microbacterium nanhaiense]GGO58967.1 hypothetical protein GCM10010910_00790 [Microbacterium nanhaiense]